MDKVLQHEWTPQREAESAGAAGISARLERIPMTGYQRKLVLIVATAFFFDSMDLAAMTFLLGSIKTTFALSTAEAGLISSLSFVGMAAGAALAGVLGDRFGRLPIFQISMIIWGIGSLACGLAPDPLWFGVARVLVGFGMGMEFPLAQSIVSELVPKDVRGRYIALLDGAWPVGFVASGALSLVVLTYLDWRWVFILEALPAVYVFILRRAVPESPRWLADKSHYERAEATMRQIETEVETRLGRKLPVPVVIYSEKPVQGGGIGELFAAQYLKRSIMVWALWFLALLGFYGLTTWLGALLQAAGYAVTKSVYYTLLISLAGIPGFLTSAWLVEAWGRKSTCVAMLLGSSVMAYFYGTSTNVNQLIGFGLAMQFCFFGMWAVLYAYTPELYPTRLRATGCGSASAVGRIGSLLGPYCVGLVLPLAGQNGVFALGAGAFALAAFVVLLLGDETAGRTLEELNS